MLRGFSKARGLLPTIRAYRRHPTEQTAVVVFGRVVTVQSAHSIQILQPNSVPMFGYSFEANDVF